MFNFKAFMREAVPTLDELFEQRPAWMRDGLYQEYPEVNFHPGLGEPTAPAKAVCARCLVRGECLQYALEHEEPNLAHGVWGGLSAKQRLQLRRARQVA